MMSLYTVAVHDMGLRLETSNRLMNIEFKNITDSLNIYQDIIDTFLNTLDIEKQYFNVTLERLLKSEMILIALSEDEIIGVGGLEIKYGMSRSIIILKKGYQGKGIGKRLSKRILEEAGIKHNIVVAVIEKSNIASIRTDLSIGYKLIGNRGDLCYLACPLNVNGWIVYFGLKMVFSLVKAVDLIRR